MEIKGYSTFPKPPALLEPRHQIVYYPFKDIRWRGGDLTPSAEMQLVYSATPANRAIFPEIF